MDVREMSPMQVALCGLSHELELASEQDTASALYDDQLL